MVHGESSHPSGRAKGPRTLAAATLTLGLLVPARPHAIAEEARPPKPNASPNGVIGVVVYSDPEWGLAFVHDGARTVLAESAGRVPPPAPGRKVEVRGRAGRVRGLPALTEARLRDLGPAPVPDPADDVAPGGASRHTEPRWSRFVGLVREVSTSQARTSLRVAANGIQLEAVLPEGSPGVAALPEVGAEVRLRGVLEPPADSWSRPVLWVAGWGDTETILRAPEWGSVPATTVAEALALWRSSSPRGEIRLQVRPVERQSLRSSCWKT